MQIEIIYNAGMLIYGDQVEIINAWVGHRESRILLREIGEGRHLKRIVVSHDIRLLYINLNSSNAVEPGIVGCKVCLKEAQVVFTGGQRNGLSKGCIPDGIA